MKLRFSIRDMFWFTLVAAIAFGWWSDYQGRRHAFFINNYYANKYGKEYEEKTKALRDKASAQEDEIYRLKVSNEKLRADLQNAITDSPK